MKNTIFTLLLAMILSGCAQSSGYYTVELLEVERPENAKERYGKSTILNYKEKELTKYSYEDDLIRIIWTLGSTDFMFLLENKSNNSLKIIWDDASYVDENGASQRVMHSGVKYTDRNNSQPSTVVAKKAIITDIVAPTENVYFVSGQYGGWMSLPLFKNTATTAEEYNSLRNRYIGKTVKVLLPLQIQDSVNEYLFSFKVADFTINKN